jgi:hypothetical protein
MLPEPAWAWVKWTRSEIKEDARYKYKRLLSRERHSIGKTVQESIQVLHRRAMLMLIPRRQKILVGLAREVKLR